MMKQWTMTVGLPTGIVNPGIHINTGWAFSQLHLNEPLTKQASLETIITQPVHTWVNNCKTILKPLFFVNIPN